jgi:hypothetical protein
MVSGFTEAEYGEYFTVTEGGRLTGSTKIKLVNLNDMAVRVINALESANVPEDQRAAIIAFFMKTTKEETVDWYAAYLRGETRRLQEAGVTTSIVNPITPREEELRRAIPGLADYSPYLNKKWTKGRVANQMARLTENLSLVLLVADESQKLPGSWGGSRQQHIALFFNVSLKTLKDWLKKQTTDVRDRF